MKIDKAEALGAYVECALWSSLDDDGTPLDRNYKWFHITVEGLTAMWIDIVNFIDENEEVLNKVHMDGEHCGHNFWLSRNGHGTGFFAIGPWPEWQVLQRHARKFGEQHLLVNPQGTLSIYPG